MKDLLKFEELQVNSSAKLDPAVSCEEGSVCVISTSKLMRKSAFALDSRTGLPSVNALEDLLELVTSHALSMKYWHLTIS